MIGFQANRRLLAVQRCSHDCALGEAAFHQVTQPVVCGEQRAAGLPFGHSRVQALLSALVRFCLLPRGFANRDLRQYLAPWLGLNPSHRAAGRMTYDLRRLRLHGLIERVPGTHRYQVTAQGVRVALFFTRTYARILRPGVARIGPAAPPGDEALRPFFEDLEAALDRWVDQANLAA